MLPGHDALPGHVEFSETEQEKFQQWLEEMEATAEANGSSLGDVIVELVFSNVGGMAIQARAASLSAVENNPIVLRKALDW